MALRIIWRYQAVPVVYVIVYGAIDCNYTCQLSTDSASVSARQLQ